MCVPFAGIMMTGRADEQLRCLGRGSGSPQPVAMGVVTGAPQMAPGRDRHAPAWSGRCGLAQLRVAYGPVALSPWQCARRSGRSGPAVADRRTNAPPRRTGVPVTLKTESPRELPSGRRLAEADPGPLGSWPYHPNRLRCGFPRGSAGQVGLFFRRATSKFFDSLTLKSA
jgi:hypothetical protein